VTPDRVEVSLEADTLTISAERLMHRAFAKATVHCMEIPYGRFERRIQLPPGRYRFLQRESVDGCLMLSIERLG
jgi:HSP20 family molecular chaperone IbpA